MPKPGVHSIASRSVPVGGAKRVSPTPGATGSILSAAGHGKIVTSKRGGGDKGPAAGKK